jgi:hypothetical protein
MMAKTKSAPKLVVALERGRPLAERLEQARAEAEEFIEQKVRELKALPDAASLPIDWLRQDLRRRHGGHCSCRVVLSLLSDTDGTV